MNSVQQHAKSYSYADYLTNWVDERVELIKGQFFKMSPAPSTEHQEILMELTGQVIRDRTHILLKMCLPQFSCPI